MTRSRGWGERAIIGAFLGMATALFAMAYAWQGWFIAGLPLAVVLVIAASWM